MDRAPPAIGAPPALRRAPCCAPGFPCGSRCCCALARLLPNVAVAGAATRATPWRASRSAASITRPTASSRDKTDFAYFMSHRDRPPLVRGKDVIEWLGDTSFALSGFLARHERRARDRAAAVDQRRRRRARHRGCLRADRRRAGRATVGGDAGRRRLSRPARRDGERAVRGRRGRAAAARAGDRRPATCRSPSASTTTPTSRRRWSSTTDSLVGYRTYPHVDRPETGQFAARALSVLLERGRPPGRALRKLPFLIPLNDQCTLVEPSKGVVARSVVAEGELVNLSYLAGFPPSDLYWCGPAVIAHAWTQEAADRAADALTREIALREAEFAVPMVSPDDGVREAMALARTASRPVVLCDTQDNPGCGATRGHDRRARSAGAARRRGRRGRLSLRCRSRGRGAQGGRRGRHRHRARRAVRARTA